MTGVRAICAGLIPVMISCAEVSPMKPTESPSTPSMSALAIRLAQDLPASDRSAGADLLEHEILPLELRELPHAERPQQIIDRVSREVTEKLRSLPAEERLHGLREIARRAEILEQLIVSQALAVARYLHEHPEALSRAATHHWLTPEVDTWRQRPVEEIVAEATARRARLARWEAEVPAAHPELWEQHRFDTLLVRYSLGPARTGVFTSATGNLAEFLREMGANVKRLDLLP
jgi:hypothetical protein